MTLVAKKQPGGSNEFEWLVGGDEGAIEVSASFAHFLCSAKHSDFYVVDAPVAPKPAKKPAEKVAPLVKDEDPSEELNDALEVSSPTKRRSTKTDK